jgi:hypothetical protein
MDTETFSCTTRIHSTGSMPSQRQYHSLYDPYYETKIQCALDGLHSGKYSNMTIAAKEEGVCHVVSRSMDSHHLPS